MLATQVEYWKLQETKQHNRETERQGQAQIDIGWANVGIARDTLAEQKQHNRETEAQGWTSISIDAAKAYETQKHNRATEAQAAAELAEKHRSNVVNESQGFEKLNQGWSELQIKTREANIKQQDADTREFTSEWQKDQGQQAIDNAKLLGFLNYGTSEEQAGASTKQAEASSSQADTAQFKAKTERGQKVSSEIRSWLSTVSDIASEWIKFAQ